MVCLCVAHILTFFLKFTYSYNFGTNVLLFFFLLIQMDVLFSTTELCLTKVLPLLSVSLITDTNWSSQLILLFINYCCFPTRQLCCGWLSLWDLDFRVSRVSRCGNGLCNKRWNRIVAQLPLKMAANKMSGCKINHCIHITLTPKM